MRTFNLFRERLSKLDTSNYLLLIITAMPDLAHLQRIR